MEKISYEKFIDILLEEINSRIIRVREKYPKEAELIEEGILITAEIIAENTEKELIDINSNWLDIIIDSLNSKLKQIKEDRIDGYDNIDQGAYIPINIIREKFSINLNKENKDGK